MINATNVPIVTTTGTSYKNLTSTVNVVANGTISIAPGSPTVVASPITQSASFKSGIYLGPHFNNSDYDGMVATVSGPGVVPGGFSNWTFSSSATSTATTPYPITARWYVGSPTSTNHPFYARLKKAGITSTAYSYGTLGNQPSDPNGAWFNGGLIGVSQAGNAITIVSFSLCCGTDYSTPQDQITFTLK